MLVLSSLLSVLVGASLGLLGGGGSILMLPILVYALGVEPAAAIPMSLLVVGTTSAVALVPHALRGDIDWRRGSIFGVAGMAGAYAGGRVSVYFPSWLLLTGFAILMLVTALAMLRKNRASDCAPRGARVVRALVQGSSVGVLSGLLGAGGGFLIVPMLVLVGGLSVRSAIGTSLLVIAMQSIAGFATHLAHTSIDTTLTAWTAGFAVAGSIVGARMSRQTPQATLRRWFAYLVLAVGLAVLIEQVPFGIWGTLATSSIAPLVGGVLIGVAAVVLWIFHGRTAGISGVTGGLISAPRGDRGWRMSFVLGLVAGGAFMARAFPQAFACPRAPLGAVALAGLLVGVGTTLANGCTSGHGVCGVARFSPRSIVATLSFIGAGMAAVYVMRHVLGA